GQMKTGRDLVIATLMGAEEWGVATAALVAGGCIMMRKCHLNTCPVGIATQDPALRKLFSGKPEEIVNLFMFLAEEMREIMADLGVGTTNEMVVKAHVLKRRTDINHWKANKVDLRDVLTVPHNSSKESLYHPQEQDHGLGSILDWELLNQSKHALETKTPVF